MKGLALCALYTFPCVGNTAQAPSLPVTQTRKSCVIGAASKPQTHVTSVTYACVCVSSHHALVDGSHRGHPRRTARTLLKSQPSMTNGHLLSARGHRAVPDRGHFLRTTNFELRAALESRRMTTWT
jgi:hypothetical protein